MKKNVVIFGSTGGLGQLAMTLLKKHKKHFTPIGISGNKNKKLLDTLAKEFDIKQTALHSKGETLNIDDADIVINVLSGIGGIPATREALKKGKTLLLANKESAIAEKASIKNHDVIPLDSEHNAIYEVLKFRSATPEEVEEIYLPCSGGPFYNRKDLKGITIKEATTHPRWNMGKKISVESATLINKGLEIIEAHYLFSLPLSKIKVFLHPECEIHGIVKFKNEALAYLAEPDMTEHMENALLRTIGKTPKPNIKPIDLKKLNPLPPNNPLLPGMEIVVNAYKKSPEKMTEFLEKEEEIINDFLAGGVEFREIMSNLKRHP